MTVNKKACNVIHLRSCFSTLYSFEKTVAHQTSICRQPRRRCETGSKSVGTMILLVFSLLIAGTIADSPKAATCPLECKSTCLNPNPKNCSSSFYSDCNCKEGTIWSSDGSKCISINECPFGPPCNGDPNAYVIEKPPACPSTCDNSNGSPHCKSLELDVGCACKNGYILNSEGTCIDPDQCPGGNPCGVNMTFVSCSLSCPDDFCAVNDIRAMIACDPPYPCPSGCVCKYKYQLRSQENRTCILAQECPPVKCTRPNEEWNSCPSPCFDESCSAFNSPPPVCNTLVEPECYPQCTCKPGYARDENDVCIPGEQCPQYCGGSLPQ